MDCANAKAISAFWRDALDYDQRIATAEEEAQALRLHPEWATMAITQDDKGRHPRLRFEEVPEPKEGRDRLRWEVGLPRDGFDREVARLLQLGADGAVPTLSHWAGGDFDVAPVDGERRMTAILWEAEDVAALTAFWAEVLEGVRDIPGIPMPQLRFVRAEGKKARKNRLHLDLFCDKSELAHERRRVFRLGATPEQPRSGHNGMFDPEGNEFCLY